MNRYTVTALAWVMVLAACATSVTYTPLNPSPHGRRPLGKGGPDVYMSSAPDRTFTEIGMLEAQQESAYSSDEAADIIRELKAEAVRYGCEGLIIVGANDRVVGTKSGVMTLKGYRATCIVYND